MGKTLSTIASMFLLSSSLFGAPPVQFASQSKCVQLVSATPDIVVLRSELSDLSVEITEVDGQRYSSLILPGEATTCYPGRPVLPVLTRFVVVSPTSNLELIISTPAPRRVRADNPPLLYKAEPGVSLESRDTDGVFPPVVAEMSEPFIVRGERMVKLTVYPVRFDNRRNEFLYYDHVETVVQSVGGDPVNPVAYTSRRDRSRSFIKVMNALAINGGEVGRDDPDRDNPDRPNGHYLIVTSAACIQYIRPFIEWRRKAGYQVDILIISDNDLQNPAAIKEGIQERYDAYLEAGLDPFDQILLVGDRSAYNNNGPNPQWVLEAYEGTTNWGIGIDHADYRYACLEGRDDLPDVGFARWISGSQSTLELAVARTLAYEATPPMDNPAWLGRTAAFTQHWGNSQQSEWHPSIPLSARWGEQLLKQKGFEDVQTYEDLEWDQSGTNMGPWLRDRFNEGFNLMIGRAQNFYWRNDFQGVNNNTVFPIFLTAANHGDMMGATMFRNGDARNLKGVVAQCFTWGELGTVSSILSSNVMWFEMVRAFIAEDLPLGWARTLALLKFEGDLPDFQWNGHNVYPMYKTDFDVIGDPGLQPWIGIPRTVQVELLNGAQPAQRCFETIVTDPDGAPVSGATVTFYAPGSLPNAAVDYANYDGYVNQTTLTDQDGRARFLFDVGQEFEAGTPLFITATGRDIKPAFLEQQFEAQSLIEISSFSLEESDGNGDGEPNPNETLALRITARNLGQESVVNLIAVVTSLSPWVEILEEDQQVQFGDVVAGQEANSNRAVPVYLHPSCPDGAFHPESRPVLSVDFIGEGGEWTSAIKLDPVAPGFELSSVIGGDVIPDTVCQLDLSLLNVGRMNAPVLSAELHSLGLGVSVIDPEAVFPAIEAQEQAQIEGRLFTVAGNRVVVPGSRHEMMLTLETETGWQDTVYFELQIRNPRANAPQGPDKFGYICFDDTDQNWDMAPEFEWIEIDPAADNPDFEGAQLGFDGRVEYDLGEAQVVPLGFQTQFYGQLFDSITVASNGFIAMGSQPRVVAFQNFPLDRGFGGGTGMIAPLWTDLRMINTSHVFVFHDADLGRFIVEWKNMRYAAAGNNIDLTFQVILYDHDVWVTLTGDQNILFQYRQAAIRENLRGGDNQWQDGVPFPSVGISSPDCKTGISYAWNNEYPVTSAPIQNGRAILFSTSSQYFACILFGRIHDARTLRPIEGAYIYTKHGFVGFTDADGYWEIPGALAEVEFDITAGNQGYNDSTFTDLIVRANDSLEINFDLLHPEFTSSSDRLWGVLDQNLEQQIPFSLFNGGNGPLTWSAEKRLIGDANAAPWETRHTYDAGDITNDDRLQGVVFGNDRFYFAGANGADASLIYVLDRDGALQDSFRQAGSSRYGFRDLEWDGDLIWGASDDSIFGFTTEGEVIYRWHGPFNPTTCIAWDSDRNLLMLSGTTTNIVSYDIEGHVIGEPIIRRGLRIYGLAYWPDDPEGYNLYILNQPAQNECLLHKMNTATGDTLRVRSLDLIEGETQMNCAFITNEWDVYSWVLMTIDNLAPALGGDRLRILQIEARKDWFDLDIWNGVLPPEQTQDFTLMINTAGLPDTLFEGELRFTHNADSGIAHIGVSLQVIGPTPPSLFDLVTPSNGDTLIGNPTPQNPLSEVLFAWNPSRDPNRADSLLRYVLHFSDLERTASYSLPDTFGVVDLDTIGLRLGVFWPFSWWVTAISGRDTVECNQRFSLIINLGEGVGNDGATPVEFGLGALYPSPFNSVTSVQFGADRSVETTLRAYDVQGRLAAVLYSGTPEVGYHKVVWEAGNLASGVYVLRLESAGRSSFRKIALVR